LGGGQANSAQEAGFSSVWGIDRREVHIQGGRAYTLLSKTWAPMPCVSNHKAVVQTINARENYGLGIRDYMLQPKEGEKGEKRSQK